MPVRVKFLKTHFFLLWFIFFVQSGYAAEPVLEPLYISIEPGKTIEYQVEVARTNRQKARGLMYRRTLPENQGMLFIYSPEQEADMWMKNTYISLDMLFIDKQGIIFNIVTNTVPKSTKTIESRGKAGAVLELNAGQVEKQGISVGDTIIYGNSDN